MNLTPFPHASPRAPRVEGSSALNDPEGLQAFGSESEPEPTPAQPPASASPRPFSLRIPVGPVLPLVIVGVVGLATGAAGLWIAQRATANRSAALKIETSVPGAEVTVSGRPAGRTPVMLAMAPGSYAVRLTREGVHRDFTVDLAGGTSVVRHVEMPAPGPTPDARRGSLLVQTEPAKLTVAVDGSERGVSPLSIADLEPGEHQVVVRGDGATIRRTVTIQAGERTVLVVSPVERQAPAVAPSAAGGWVTLASPIALTVTEGGKVLGSTDLDRIMMPAGEHTLEFRNEALGFQARRTVRIEAGKTAAVKIDPPNGVLNINALPWAEVWVGGERIGETPIGRLTRPIGQHEVVLRHPEFGERRETVTVTLKQTARLGVDMRKK
jgi:hypothetical protein